MRSLQSLIFLSELERQNAPWDVALGTGFRGDLRCSGSEGSKMLWVRALEISHGDFQSFRIMIFAV